MSQKIVENNMCMEACEAVTVPMVSITASRFESLIRGEAKLFDLQKMIEEGVELPKICKVFGLDHKKTTGDRLAELLEDVVIEKAKEKKAKAEKEAAEDPEPETEDEAEITASTMAINREAERILSMLDQKDRDLLSLRLAAQLSFAEIAQIMEISPKAATERYRRLIGRCRKLTEGLSMSDF